MNKKSFDAHWYRRIVHVFSASFLIYYMLPDKPVIEFYKLIIPVIIVSIAIIVEYSRLKGLISSSHFFGLRIYEKKRVSSYLYFGIGILILLLFFPQQIAIPCILCASIGDPVIGELRYRFSWKKSMIIGFLICMIFFIITWYTAGIPLMIIASIIGATGAIVGEFKKFWWIDDDFMIQMLPGFLLLAIWFIISYFGLNHPTIVIYPWGIVG